MPRRFNSHRPIPTTTNWPPKNAQLRSKIRTLSAVIAELTHETSGANVVVSMPRKHPGRVTVGLSPGVRGSGDATLTAADPLRTEA